MAWGVGLPENTSKIRLSAGYIRSNNLAIQQVISASNLNAGTAYIPITHPIFFYSDTNPAGWTIVDAPTDCLLALKGGSTYTAGGSPLGSWQQEGVGGGNPGGGLSIAQLPAHVHQGNLTNSSSAGGTPRVSSSGTAIPGITGNAQNNNGSQTAQGLPHNHGATWRPFAAVGIFCTKDA